MPPMNPEQYIQDLCQRYGVSATFGRRMLPLAQRSERVRPEMRRRLRAFLERSFVAQAKLEAEEAKNKRRGSGALKPGEERALGTVAGILHDWDPPRWLQRWARRVQDDAPGGGPQA